MATPHPSVSQEAQSSPNISELCGTYYISDTFKGELHAFAYLILSAILLDWYY